MQDNIKYSCFTVDSIRLMAEGACILEPTVEVASSVSEDATFKLRQIITRAIKFMRHANRTKLRCSDINKALRWSDCQPVFGHECNPSQRLRYSYSAGAQVFKYEDDEIDLVEKYKSQVRTESLLTNETPLEVAPNLEIEVSRTVTQGRE